MLVLTSTPLSDNATNVKSFLRTTPGSDQHRSQPVTDTTALETYRGVCGPFSYRD